MDAEQRAIGARAERQPSSGGHVLSGGSSSGSSLHSVPPHPSTQSAYRFVYVNPEATDIAWCKLVNTTKEGDRTVVIGKQRKKPQTEGVFSKHKTRQQQTHTREHPHARGNDASSNNHAHFFFGFVFV